jgi:tetratricopeptide (TPR) repeat protein
LRLVEGGSSGSLSGMAPSTEPIVWTSLATGRFPEHHGVLGESEIRPDGGGVQPIGRRSWRAPAFWEVLSAAGLSTAVINWPATAPAVRWPGIVIDETVASPVAMDFETWPLAPDSVSPESMRAIMRDLRVHPAEIGMRELVDLVPRAAEIDQRRDRRLARLSISLARASSVHAAATYVAETATWDMLAVRYSLLSDVRRDIAPKPEAEPDPLDTLYGNAVAASCRFLDQMLARLLTLSGENTTILFVGPYIRPITADNRDSMDPNPRPPSQGMIVAAGSDIASDALVQGATIFDLCPSVLKFYGLSSDSDGRPLPHLFAARQPNLRKIAPPAIFAEEQTDEAAHLYALGYTDQRGVAEERAIAEAEQTARRNLADSLMARGEWRKAAAVLETALLQTPDDYGSNMKLCQALLQLGDVEAARPVAETVLAMDPTLPWGDLAMGVVLALEGNGDLAGVHLQRARELGRGVAKTLVRIGGVYLILQRGQEAENIFADILARDPRNAEAHAGLALSLEAQGKDVEAEAALRTAIAIAPHNPLAYLSLTKVLARRCLTADAMKAARIALAQQPRSSEAKTLLAKLEDRLNAEIAAQSVRPKPDSAQS